MPTPLRRRLRIARRAAWYAVAVSLVLMALVAGVLSQLLPLAERHPGEIAAWLSTRAGRPVTFTRLETRWTRRGPLLRLDDMRVGEGSKAVILGDVEMLIAQYAGLLPGRSFTELRLRGLDLTLEQERDGRWTIRGLPSPEQPTGGDPFDPLEGLGELQVIGGKLSVVAPALGIQAHLPRVDMRLRVDGDRVRVGARAWARTDRAPLAGVVDFDRNSGNGRIYVGAHRADLSTWSSLLGMAGLRVTGGTGRAEAWASLRRHRLASVTVDAALDHLRVRGAPLPVRDAAANATQVQLDGVRTRLRWRALAGRWLVDAPLLRIDAGRHQQTLDGLIVGGGQRFGLLADRVDAGPLLSIAALSDRLAPDLRHWLLAAGPDATLSDVVIVGSQRNGALRASARIDGLRFAPAGSAPGLSGLSGWLDGDARAARFRFDPAASASIDWPLGFGGSQRLTLGGDIVAWREPDRWRVSTPGLLLSTQAGARVHARGGLEATANGPHLDLAAQVDDFPVTAAKGFWIRHLMSPATIQWLDTALVSGRVHDGRALISGDLRDWPFIGHDGQPGNGAFKATGQLRDAVLKFDPGWPALEHADADFSFAGDGFTVGGKGVIAGVGVRRFDAGIAHFGVPKLAVHALGGGDASRLLGLLQHSPLHATYGETIDNITASGLADVGFDLQLPFVREAGPGSMGGTVSLAGARLTEKRFDVAFDNVRGRATYGNDGFQAERLSVLHAGKPGRLSLRAGRYVRDPTQAFEADLDAVVPADLLIARAPQLDWLKPYLDGSSTWTVGVSIPRADGKDTSARPTRLQLRSDLLGTAITLPAPLRKAASVALPAKIDIALPLGAGEVKVGLGNLIAVRARSTQAAGGQQQTGVRVVLGGNAVAEAPPASGLVATGHADVLDALDWIAVTRGGGSGQGAGALALRSVDVTASRLRLLGAEFPDTRLQLQPGAGATLVSAQGNALAGNLRIPDAEGAVVAGRFQRVLWRNLPANTPSGTVGGGSPVADPAKLPPLAIDVADFRVGSASLGAMTLRTQPTAAGLHIQQLQTRAPGQQIDVHGDWTGRGATARTQLGVVTTSNDFGALVAGFGYAGQLSDGHGSASLDAGWPGSPADFKLANLIGTLHLAIRDGQLVELEPGAGRVLGLLSLAQLPRRLTLDFHDFFEKGFAFGKVDGDVHLGAGQARTDNLVIDGPAAEIRIRGAADLLAQQYDQTILVLPRTGNLLTAVGAIAGGPVGAAIGAAANEMLKKPLGRLGAKTYRVTGPWKDPKVEIIGRESSRAPPARATSG
jgi:uncharacterized protein (TIGR02099 family)